MPIPATTLRVIKGIGFQSDYNNVILFDNAENQSAYFMKLPGKNYSQQSYQRVGSGYVKLNDSYEFLCECSYLMFRNTAHEDRWWYAFITDVEYINEQTVGVHFAIDIMQSYMFNWSLGHCFVEREHSATDEVGDNLVKENLFFGPYEYDGTVDNLTVTGSNLTFGFDRLTMEDLCVVIAYNPAIIDLAAMVDNIGSYLWKENIYNGVYQGIRFIALPATQRMDNIEDIIQSLDGLFGAFDFLSFGGVLACYMMPIIFLPPKDTPNWTNKRHYLNVNRPTTLKGYSPKNNKLLTYPYVCVNMTNHRSEGVDYAFEYFMNGVASFAYEGNLSLNPSCMAYPIGYKGKAFATEEGVSLDAFPLATWGADGITEWVNNNLFKAATGIGLTAATSGASAYASAFGASSATVIPNVVPGVTAGEVRRGLSDRNPAIEKAYTATPRMRDRYATPIARSAASDAGVMSALGYVADAASAPGQVQGIGGSDLMFGNPFGLHISPRIKTINSTYAKTIDDFFTKYGYATNEVKVPNLKSRPLWNYVKLHDVHLEDITCPMNVVAEVRSIFERGVTFWRPSAVIGDYSADNTV